MQISAQERKDVGTSASRRLRRANQAVDLENPVPPVRHKLRKIAHYLPNHVQLYPQTFQMPLSNLVRPIACQDDIHVLNTVFHIVTEEIRQRGNMQIMRFLCCRHIPLQCLDEKRIAVYRFL